MDYSLLGKVFFLRADGHWSFGEKVDAGDFDDYAKGQRGKLPVVEWLTVSNCALDVEGLAATCKIQLTAKATLRAEGCVFNPLPLDKTEAAVEVFANSRATFDGCLFFGGERTAVIVRNHSLATFRNCLFANNKISVFAMDSAICTFEGCRFVGGENAEVFVTKDSQALLGRCVFEGGRGKGLLAKDRSIVVVEKTSFRERTRGAITACGCQVDLGDLRIADIGSTAILLLDGCRAKGQDLAIENVEGNCLNLSNSHGTFRGCLFARSKYPAIATMGRRCNPVFVNCRVSDCESFMAISKLLAVPTFRGCVFEGCGSHAFSVTTLSHPTVDGCLFGDIAKEDICLSVYGGVRIVGDGRCGLKKEEDCVVGDGLYKEEEEEEEDYVAKSWVSPSYVTYGDVERLAIEEEEGSKPLDIGRRLEAIRNRRADYMNLPCGHCFSKKEGDEDEEKEKEEECAVCSCRIRKRAEVRDFGECAICLDNPACAVCIPCGHKAMCAMCAIRCLEEGFRCPACNEDINSITFT